MPKITQEQRDLRRGRILSAARRCFIRQGFHGTSMPDLLAESGVSSGALYGYFAGKEEVIVAIAEENMDAVRSALRDAPGNPGRADPSATLSSVLEVIRHQHAENGFASIALLVWSEGRRNPVLAEQLTALLDEMHEAFGVADEGPPSQTALPDPRATIFTSIVAGFILHLAVLGPGSIEDVPTMVSALGGERPPGSPRVTD